eukprot:TRINITY_DN487_c0_g1_i3.p1 TRINITY_DN487_c0_g1~~TRINITY_DN487_c0_g1_i3.p1  ORF type:complete len:714 (+),score=189.35 TRINITY_DN487_c0_g1_i3:267-2408(+)
MNDLRERLTNWSEEQVVGDVFIATIPYFKHYKGYMSNYENAIATLEKTAKRKEVAAWLKASEAQSEGQKLAFLLIQPVQRIPRYNLLLSELMKKTPESHPDHQLINKALQQIKEIADHVNYSVREQENRTKLLKILEDTKKYVGFEPLLLPHRVLIHEGEVKLTAADKIQWMLLFNDILVFANITDRNEKKERRIVDETLELDKVWFDDPAESVDSNKLTNLYGTDNIIEVVHPKVTITLQLPKREDKVAWLKYAQTAIVDNLRNLKRVVKGDGSPERGIREFEYEFPGTKAKYSGDWEIGKPHGQGVYVFNDGATYAGSFKIGKMDGKGKIQYKCGDYYEGEWKGDLFEGFGKLVTGKTVCEGVWGKGKRNGKCVMTWANGDYYDGEFKENSAEGFGVWVSSDGTKYEGEWKSNMFHGKGRLENMNGVYDGDWIEDIKQGKGRMAYVNGDEYDGEWANDMRDGTGSFTSADRRTTYEGEWLQDRMHGKGVFKIEGLFTYEGAFKEDRRDGFGIMTWPDGSKYTGNWLDNKKEGTGRMEYADKSVYDGLWRGDKRHGLGNFTGSDGSVYEGNWERDTKEGVGVYIWPNGAKYSGTWKNDKRHGKGVFTTPGETVKYTGEWMMDMRHGKGVQTDISGTFDGDWVNDKQHGKGKFTSSTCAYYGTWFNNLLDSSGIANFQGMTGPISYYWSNGKMEQPTNRIGPPLLPALKTRFQ